MGMNSRESILNKALELFSRKGYEGTGIQAVCEASGITKPTLYYFFGSKQGLLEELLSEKLKPFIIHVTEASFYERDIHMSLERIGRVFFTFAGKNPLVYRLFLQLWFTPVDSESHQAAEKWTSLLHEPVEKLFLSAAADHGNMRGRHQAYALSFTGVINTYIGLMLNGHLELNDALLYQVLRQFKHGIFS